MVTGAGGSIGSEIVRQVTAAGAAKVLVVERGENVLYEINREMNTPVCVPLMIDINDQVKMDALFAQEIAARRGAAVGGAGLEGDVEGCAGVVFGAGG